MLTRERKLSRDASHRAQTAMRTSRQTPLIRVNSLLINKLKSRWTGTCMEILSRVLHELPRSPSRDMVSGALSSNRSSSNTSTRPSLRLARRLYHSSLHTNPSPNTNRSHSSSSNSHRRANLKISTFMATLLRSNRRLLINNNIIIALHHLQIIKHNNPHH